MRIATLLGPSLLLSLMLLAQPSPPLALPTSPDLRVFCRTNSNGDTVYTMVVPRPRTDPPRHYFGVLNGSPQSLEYIGEFTQSQFLIWSSQGTTIAGGGPQIQRWLCIFCTTNRIDTPTLQHARICP